MSRSESMSQSESRSNGMPESMVQIRNVTKVYERGKTIVMVTHDPKAAEFARRTLHLEKGQLLEQAA